MSRVHKQFWHITRPAFTVQVSVAVDGDQVAAAVGKVVGEHCALGSGQGFAEVQTRKKVWRGNLDVPNIV